jgi:vacuolar protein sorting-associated protein VTA1
LHPSSQIDPQNFYQPHASPIDQAPYVPPNVPQQPHAVQQSLSIPQASILPPVAVSQFTQRAPENLIADDEAMLQAQKHAKWAISALNFEDVPTAVKELRHALEALGAR